MREGHTPLQTLGASRRRPVTSLPSFAEILIDQTKIEGETVDSLNERIEDSYRNHLY